MSAISNRKTVLVRMPGELKRRLADEVAAQRSNLNDVAVGILASRFGVPFEPSRRQAAAPGASGDVVLRMPPELSDKLKRRAAERSANTNDLIIDTLADRLRAVQPPQETLASPNGKAPRREENVRGAAARVGHRAKSPAPGGG